MVVGRAWAGEIATLRLYHKFLWYNSQPSFHTTEGEEKWRIAACLRARGPGKVLSGLVKKIDAALTAVNVADLASLDAALAALA